MAGSAPNDDAASLRMMNFTPLRFSEAVRWLHTCNRMEVCREFSCGQWGKVRSGASVQDRTPHRMALRLKPLPLFPLYSLPAVLSKRCRLLALE